jgi:hypothetical protein
MYYSRLTSYSIGGVNVNIFKNGNFNSNFSHVSRKNVGNNIVYVQENRPYFAENM